MSSLLPSNATALEQAAAQALAEIERVNIPLRQLWNPETCPISLLPYLAWAFSVDRWDASWAEPVKREVVRSAFYVHRRKGTISALRRVVEPLGYLLRVEEWWETDPQGTPGTFRIDIGVLESGITEDTYIELERLIDDAKPLARHLVGLAIKLESRGKIHLAAASVGGDEMTVYPHSPGPIEVSATAHPTFAQHIIDTVSVRHHD